MSNATIQKADQIAYRFYTKLAAVLNTARATIEPNNTHSKPDKWFNLETNDSDIFKEHLRIYRAVSVTPLPPPLEIHVRLVVPPDLSHDQVLVHIAPDMSRLRIEPTPRYILLESWILSFTPTPMSPGDDEQHILDIAPSTIYKHGIPLFRSLYSLLRILPAWKYSRRLRRRTGGVNRNANLTIELAIPGSSSQEDNQRLLRFDTAPAPNTAAFLTAIHSFPSVPHPAGSLSLSVTYLTAPTFQLDELESLLSSRFLSLDSGPEFTPTLAKNQQQHSVSASASASPSGSIPPRASSSSAHQQAVSPASSVAERFILPTRVASLGISPRNVPLPIARSPSAAAAAAESHSHSLSAGSSAWSGDARPLSAARLRKESLGRGGDLPSAPSPLPIRRPNINPVHPFKASTLSSGSPSPYHHHHSPNRQSSPLSSPALPSRPVQTSPTLPRVPLPTPSGSSAHGPGVSRPSPPFTPSSLGDRRSVLSAESGEQQLDRDGNLQAPAPSPSPRTMSAGIMSGGHHQRKRYSSSFGHRYAASVGAGSEGSAGSGERERERVASASFLTTNTDDDDLSMFVQEIDARKPLGRMRTRAVSQGQCPARGGEYGYEYGHHHHHHHRRTESVGGRMEAGGSGSPRQGAGGGTGGEGGLLLPAEEESSGSGSTGSGSAAGQAASRPMLTNESDVDERLREMNAVFLASLEGLGTTSRRRGGGAGNSGGSRSGSGSGASSRSRSAVRPTALALTRARDRSRSEYGSTGTSSLGLGENLLQLRMGGEGSSIGQGSDEVIGRLELDRG